uniref:Uncharacterized protein n=1 Tax=Megaselia scalaris TaxID=36166 RepID=T1GB89_MEGSC
MAWSFLPPPYYMPMYQYPAPVPTTAYYTATQPPMSKALMAAPLAPASPPEQPTRNMLNINVLIKNTKIVAQVDKQKMATTINCSNGRKWERDRDCVYRNDTTPKGRAGSTSSQDDCFD